MPFDPADELRATVAKLGTVDAHRANLIEYRARQIVAALDGGMTWAQVRQITGLSLRGVQLAIARAKSADTA